MIVAQFGRVNVDVIHLRVNSLGHELQAIAVLSRLRALSKVGTLALGMVNMAAAMNLAFSSVTLGITHLATMVLSRMDPYSCPCAALWLEDVTKTASAAVVLEDVAASPSGVSASAGDGTERTASSANVLRRLRSKTSHGYMHDASVRPFLASIAGVALLRVVNAAV